MNQNNNKNKYFLTDNSFFFFIDSLNDFESKLLKTKRFFPDFYLLSPIKFFSVFKNNKVDFDFLEKNEKMFFFFLFLNKLFFKSNLKLLKILLKNEDILSNLKLKFNLNFFSFFCYIFKFVFLLKKISSLKQQKTIK